MAVKLLFNGIPQVEDTSGNPYSGARWFFYAAGSSTKQNVYSDSAGLVAVSNPCTVNSAGYPAVSGNIVQFYGTVGQTYKIGLAAPGSDDPPASFIWTADNVSPINDTTVTIDQWVSGPTPTFVGATSFTLIGDQTSTFTVGRRLKTTNSGGAIYSRIVSSVFGATTTVTVVNDSGVLDSGLSAVSYGLITPENTSAPAFRDNTFRLADNADPTKVVAFELSGLTTATTRTLTVPDADLTLVGVAATQTLTNKTLTSPVIDTAVTGTAVASQAQMETGTATNLIVTPGRLQNHPGAVKGWVQAGVSADVASSYNVTSLTDGGSGIVTVTWETDMSGTNYCAIGTAKAASSGTSFYCPFISNTSFAAGTTRMDVWHGVTGSQAPIDPTHFMILILGDQ